VGEAVDQRGRRLCQLVHKHLWPESRDRLIAGCQSPEDALRLNSYEVLELAKATDAADRLAYHAANLAYHYWPAKQAQALDFLKSVAPAERPRALEALRAAAAKLAAKGDRDSLDMAEKIKQAIAAMEKSG
jgi:hypothetical protein